MFNVQIPPENLKLALPILGDGKYPALIIKVDIKACSGETVGCSNVV